MSSEAQRLSEAIHKIIAEGPDGDGKDFDALALEVFAYQFKENAPYREYCQLRKISPDTVTTWRDIPAFPTDAFKTDLVTSFPAEKAVMAQLTSGTSANGRGQIFRDEIGRELVFAANRVMTGAYLFPDFDDAKRCRVLILAPSPEMAPSMGVAMGMEETRRCFGAPNSEFLLTHSGIDIKRMIAALEEAEQGGQPIAFIGTTGAFVYFFNACRKKGISFRLPHGSRIGDGGGYQGRFGKVDRDQYFQMAADILGIPADHCVNVLGMAESATNFFETPLREKHLGRSDGGRRLVPPPWTRTDTLDATSLEPLPPGQIGLLRHFDLANLPTVLGVQTDNLGYCNADGSFHIIGRAKVEDGKISRKPAQRTVGPLGDNRIFRFLETYVNFSIRFKMGFATRRRPTPQTDDMIAGAACTCADGIEQVVAGEAADDVTQERNNI